MTKTTTRLVIKRSIKSSNTKLEESLRELAVNSVRPDSRIIVEMLITQVHIPKRPITRNPRLFVGNNAAIWPPSVSISLEMTRRTLSLATPEPKSLTSPLGQLQPTRDSRVLKFPALEILCWSMEKRSIIWSCTSPKKSCTGTKLSLPAITRIQLSLITTMSASLVHRGTTMRWQRCHLRLASPIKGTLSFIPHSILRRSND